MSEQSTWFEREAYRQLHINNVLRSAIEQVLAPGDPHLLAGKVLRAALAEADRLAQGEPPR